MSGYGDSNPDSQISIWRHIPLCYTAPFSHEDMKNFISRFQGPGSMGNYSESHGEREYIVFEKKMTEKHTYLHMLDNS